jgi:hypothetical protein
MRFASGSEVEIVQDGNHRHAASGPSAGCGHHVELMAKIEIRRGLVEQKQARTMRRFPACELNQHPGEMRALLLAPR